MDLNISFFKTGRQEVAAERGVAVADVSMSEVCDILQHTATHYNTP